MSDDPKARSLRYPSDAEVRAAFEASSPLLAKSHTHGITVTKSLGSFLLRSSMLLTETSPSPFGTPRLLIAYSAKCSKRQLKLC